jgi:type II secretory pathway pseudopilin PulG
MHTISRFVNMHAKYRFLVRTVMSILLLIILAALIPPLFPRIPQPSKITIEQNKMATIAGLIDAYFQATGNMPKTTSEIQDWASKERGWKNTDPIWYFKNPNNEETHAWILISKGKSFILQSPRFKIGKKEIWLEQNEVGSRAKKMPVMNGT